MRTFLVLTCLAAASAADAQDAKALRARGLELGYNLDHFEALDAFRAAIAADPDESTAYSLAAAIAWIRLLFDQGAITVDDYLGQARPNIAKPAPNPQLAAAFHDSLRRAIDISEEALRAHPSEADAHYQAGSAYGFLASYTATIEGRLAGSFAPARRAYREHERALALDPERAEAGLIVGMYRYAVANMNAPLRLIAHLAGFGGDRDRALRLVEAAARRPSDVQPNAQFTLILMYNREARYDDALRIIDALKARYPRNRLLWLEQANTALRAGRAPDARRAVEDGLARFADDRRPKAFGEESRWRYVHGAALAALGDPAAEAELRDAIALAAHDWVRGRAHKELGRLAGLHSDRAHALVEYRLAESLCRRDRDGDCLAEVRTLIKTGER